MGQRAERGYETNKRRVTLRLNIQLAVTGTTTTSTTAKQKSHCKLHTSTDAHANPILSSDVPSGSAISFPWFKTYFIYVLVGKLRLAKWFIPLSSKAKAKIVQDLTHLTLSRRQRSCNFIEYKGTLIINSICNTALLTSLPGEKVFWQALLPEITIEHPKTTTWIGRISPLCVAFLHLPNRRRRQWAANSRNHPSIRRDFRRVFWQCAFSPSLLVIRFHFLLKNLEIY